MNQILIVLIMIFGVCHPVYSEECDFSYLMREIPLFSSLSKEKIKEELMTGNLWAGFQEALPNVRRASISESDHFVALLGWSELSDNMELLNRNQAIQGLQETEKMANIIALQENSNIKTRISDTDPLTLYTTKKYLIENESWQDASIDIIATSKCIVSIKVSSPDKGNLNWSKIYDEFESIRRVIIAKHGRVSYDSSHQRISKAGIYYTLIMTSISAFMASLFYMIYMKLFILTPGKLTRAYSMLIIVFSILYITITILANEALGMKVVVMPYELIISSLILIPLNLWSYKMQSKKATLIAISFIIGSLITQVIYGLTGWINLKTSGWFGVIIGFILVGYVLTKSSTRVERRKEKDNVI